MWCNDSLLTVFANLRNYHSVPYSKMFPRKHTTQELSIKILSPPPPPTPPPGSQSTVVVIATLCSLLLVVLVVAVLLGLLTRRRRHKAYTPDKSIFPDVIQTPYSKSGDELLFKVADPMEFPRSRLHLFADKVLGKFPVLGYIVIDF